MAGIGHQGHRLRDEAEGRLTTTKAMLSPMPIAKARPKLAGAWTWPPGPVRMTVPMVMVVTMMIVPARGARGVVVVVVLVCVAGHVPPPSCSGPLVLGAGLRANLGSQAGGCPQKPRRPRCSCASGSGSPRIVAWSPATAAKRWMPRPSSW